MHALVVKKLYKHASYFTVNVSLPNAPGLRKLQDKESLTAIVQVVNGYQDEMGLRKNVYVKISPDLTSNAVNDVIEVILDNRLAGIVIANASIDFELKAKYREEGNY